MIVRRRPAQKSPPFHPALLPPYISSLFSLSIQQDPSLFVFVHTLRPVGFVPILSKKEGTVSYPAPATPDKKTRDDDSLENAEVWTRSRRRTR